MTNDNQQDINQDAENQSVDVESQTTLEEQVMQDNEEISAEEASIEPIEPQEDAFHSFEPFTDDTQLRKSPLTWKKITAVVAVVLVVCLLGGIAIMNFMRGGTAGSDTVLATIGKEKVYLVDAQSYLDQYISYGVVDPNDLDSIKSIKEDIIKGMVEFKVLVHMAKDLGMDKLTEEEAEELKTNVDDTYQQIYDSFKEQITQEQGELSDMQMKIEVEKLIKENRASKKLIETYYLEELLVNKVQDEVLKNQEVSDEDVQRTYDEQLITQKEQLEQDPEYYQGILYPPAGGVRVKHILIPFDGNASQEIQSLRYSDNEEDQAKADEMRGEALAIIQLEADAILEMVKRGDDFDTLIAEHGQDPGMLSGSDYQAGYLIDPNYRQMVDEFHDASLLLAKEGDVTGLVASDFGYHIIKRYPDLASFELVKDKMREIAEQESNTRMIDETVAAFKEKNTINTYIDRWQ